MGWHDILQRQILDLEANKKIKQPAGEALMLSGGTPNFQMMAAAGWLYWAVRYGKPADVTAALARCCALTQQQVSGVGLMLSEQLAGDPHFNFHWLATGTMRRLAIELGGVGLNLKTFTGALYRLLWKALEPLVGVNQRDQRPLIWLCGMRCEGGPTSQVADQLWRLTHKMEFPRWWSGKVAASSGFQSVRLAAALLEAGDDLGGAPGPNDRPKLAIPMHVAREGDHLQAWIDKPPGLDVTDVVDGHNSSAGGFVEPGDWVDADVRTGVYTFGKFWKTPRPSQPPGPVVTVG